jgi:4'-phosphopantetheinyl transferase EntD
VSDRRVALVEVPIVTGADASLLSDVERAHAAAFKSARRVDEFVAGRLAARRAIASLLGGERDVVVDREENGAPRVVGLDAELVLSITHGRTRALAAVAEGPRPFGIDLTDDRDVARIRRVARRAFPRDDERSMALANDRAARRAWAIKESIGKALRIGLLYDAGFERIVLASLDPVVVQVDGADPALSFDVTEREDGVLVVARG